MTAFEILLNRLYDTIESSKPSEGSPNCRPSSKLSQLIREYIDTSFNHGCYLSYQPTLTSIVEESAMFLKQLTFEEWEKIRSTFTENDLHIIRRDRGKQEVIELKNRLDQVFLN